MIVEKKLLLGGVELRRGITKSCGCYHKDDMTIHGMTNTRFFRIWGQILTRCCNKNSINYSNYGGCGVTVCDRWKDFLNFKEDMYESYLDHVKKFGEGNTSIDRIDSFGNYEPSNCRWATNQEQANNKRGTLKIDGVPLSIIAKLENVSYKVVYRRYKKLNNINMEELK